jgi:pSer/pThr/pTyr-binding forkhead associated (FHA) protein
MFALEISFQDGVSQPEMIFIRRPQGVVGSSDYAHVVVEDLKAIGCQLRLVRDLGRKFRCKPTSSGDESTLPAVLEGTYDGEADIDLGSVRLHVTALDFDLLLRETEPPDRAGVRVLRQSCSSVGPVFPAVVVRGAPPMVVSFVPDQPLFIGRSKQCPLRLDNADISAKHARLGYEGGEFWIEDLGSTNGTFVNHQQISGRMNVQPGTPIILGREVTLIGVAAHEQLEQAITPTSDPAKRSPSAERRYPAVTSASEVARPARLALAPGMSLVVGRDPGCDMWLGAPHVSRRHCTIAMSKTGALTVQDTSTNGTGHEQGVLRKGEIMQITGSPRVFDFGGGVTVAICFNESQEREFAASSGALFTFQPPPAGERAVKSAEAPGERKYEGSSARRIRPPEDSESKGSFGGYMVEYYSNLTVVGRLIAVLMFAIFAVLTGVLFSLIWGMVR